MRQRTTGQRARICRLRVRLGGALGLWALLGSVHAGEIPLLYQQIAARYQLSPTALYQLAVQRSGRQSRFAKTPTPWPWTVRLCQQAVCETLYAPDRPAMAHAVAAGQAAGLTVFVGPLGLALNSVPGLPILAATSARVTLNEAARQVALALATRDAARGKAASLAVATPSGSVSEHPRGPLARRWGPLVNRIAQEEGLAPSLVHAIVAAESAYNPMAVSPKNAMGLMQLMPATAERFGLPRAQRFDPEANVRAGSRYLKWLLAYFDHDLTLAVAGYNAGEGAVNRFGRRVPPYKETQNYVRRVRQFMADAQRG